MPYCARGGIAANRHSVRHEIAERSIHLSVACLNLKQSCLTPGAIGGLALRRMVSNAEVMICVAVSSE